MKNKIHQFDIHKLNKLETYVILNKGTEIPFSGEYNNCFLDGIYVCKLCGLELFDSINKFKSHCGWPSFDDCIENNVEIIKDKDGIRNEIICVNCKGHLGHVFYDEGFTDKMTRHCVNSISIVFKGC